MVPILWHEIVLCILICIIIVFGGIVLSVGRMKERTAAVETALQSQIDYRVNQTLRLLEWLSTQDIYTDPESPLEEKISTLNEVNGYFGYMMICYVDSDMNVHSENGATSLASRGYMQRLFATGESQVTDSFLAGADGKTLNYTIAVPLKRDGQITGAIFCGLYFHEFVDLMQVRADSMNSSALLLGSENQIMSATKELFYGDLFLEIMKNSKMLNMNNAVLEAELLNRSSGTFWAWKDGDLLLFSYLPIKDTPWTLISYSSFLDTYGRLLNNLWFILFASIVLFAAATILIRRYINSQMKVVDVLVQSVRELERKIYQGEGKDDANFNDIIQLTTKGLSDGLTGVVTRSVFMDQFKSMLKKNLTNQSVALCFVDLDDLKKVNDTYGHKMGDICLKSVGYVLREYEKKYEGLVGRYGGDEFVLLLCGFDDEAEMREILDELVLRLHTSVTLGNKSIPIKCSLGVSIWDGITDVDTLIKQADEALYFVKQNGKGYYKIYQD